MILYHVTDIELPEPNKTKPNRTNPNIFNPILKDNAVRFP